MLMRRVRLVLAATTAGATLSYGVAGHTLAHAESHDGMAGAAAGLCLLLATALWFTVGPKPAGERSSPVHSAVPGLVVLQVAFALDGRARASPSTLQRFRN